MKDYHLPKAGSFCSYPFTNELIVSSNKAIIRLVGAHILRLKAERGLSYPAIAKRTGCCATTVYRICKGDMDYCGISLLSKLSLSFGYTLEELLLRPITSDFNAFGIKK